LKRGADDGLVRLNKFIADHGVASRRKSDELIVGGQVTVDGEIVTELGTRIDPDTQRVEVHGIVLGQEGGRRRYYLLNKPRGVVCTNEPRELRPRAIDLIKDKAAGRIYTVGRLDERTSGVVILTNDGEFANRIMHPRYVVPKTYKVKVQGRITDQALRRAREGVWLAEGRTSGARILVKSRREMTSTLEVTITEGKNRELRRIFASVGHKVVDLQRIRIGPISDRGLKVGHWRPLASKEIRALLEASERGEAGEDPLAGGRPGARPRRGRRRR
jgi:23S rRNA pseudouridine2605 synthase